MQLSAVTIIFLFIVCLAGGIVIGVMFNRFMKSTSETPGRDELKDRFPTPEELPKAVETGILRLGRNEKDELWVELDGQRLKNKKKIKPEQNEVLAGFVGDLSTWLDLAPLPSPESPAYEPLPAENSAFSRSFPQPRQANKKTGSIPPKEAALSATPKSIVQQIDVILQKKLVGTAFSNLDIRLLEGPQGEVNVMIGAVKHLGVDAIPNSGIQELIRQAVTEWENEAR